MPRYRIRYQMCDTIVGSSCFFKTRLRLEVQLDYFQTTQTVRNVPIELIADAVAKHCSA
jgi:hypothetical protein